MPSHVQCSKFRAPSTLLDTNIQNIEAKGPFPMCEMVEGVADRLTVPPLEDVLGRQDQRLHLQQILRDVRVELHRP